MKAAYLTLVRRDSLPDEIAARNALLELVAPKAQYHSRARSWRTPRGAFVVGDCGVTLVAVTPLDTHLLSVVIAPPALLTDSEEDCLRSRKLQRSTRAKVEITADFASAHNPEFAELVLKIAQGIDVVIPSVGVIGSQGATFWTARAL